LKTMSLLDQVKKTAFEGFKTVATAMQAPPTVSCFKQKGFLTPEEFVQAGDVLVHSCRTWQWEAGDAAAALPYLPKDKQFLVTSNVPCRDLKTSLTERTVEDDVDGGWTETLTDATGSSGGGAAAIEDVVEAAAGGMAAVSVSDEVDLDDIPDADDESAAVSVVVAARDDGAADQVVVERTRTYDVSITYDPYHWTQRLWLFGYDEARQPLSPEKLMEDMSQDHAEKTVTIDPHPHILGVPYVSIHPCRHAEVMQRLVARMEESGHTVSPDQSMFLFLKLISSAIPTIEYDFTHSM